VCMSTSNWSSSRRPSMATIMLMPISTEVPPEVVDRLRAAALQVGIRQGDIIALALDAFLEEEGL
jgi:hypothetical protein